MNVLLMTATVDPEKTPVVTLRDPQIRLIHYVAATILWTRRSPFDAIVLCENSGKGAPLAGLQSVVEAAGKAFEFLPFTGNSGSWEKGKGYGEGVILEYAMSRSVFLKSTDSVWKTTGRLYVENSESLVALHRSDENVMDPGDTRFYKISREFFSGHMVRLYDRVNDHAGTSIEVSYERAFAGHRQSRRIVPFKEPKKYIGQDAGSGNWHLLFPQDVFREAEAFCETKKA